MSRMWLRGRAQALDLIPNSEKKNAMEAEAGRFLSLRPAWFLTLSQGI